MKLKILVLIIACNMLPSVSMSQELHVGMMRGQINRLLAGRPSFVQKDPLGIDTVYDSVSFLGLRGLFKVGQYDSVGKVLNVVYQTPLDKKQSFAEWDQAYVTMLDLYGNPTVPRGFTWLHLRWDSGGVIYTLTDFQDIIYYEETLKSWMEPK